MVWIIIIGILLLLFSGPISEFYKESNYALRRKERKNQNLPYNIKRTKLLEEIGNAEKYDDWKNVQNLRKDLLWLETILEFEYHKRGIKIGKENIISNFTNKDIIVPDIFSFKDLKHQLYAENAGIAFEQAYSKVVDIDLGFTKALNPESANSPKESDENNKFSEKNLPYPRDFINKALSFLYAYHKENPKYEHGVNQMPPDYFEELTKKLELFI